MSYGEYQPQPPPPGYGAQTGGVYASIGKRILAHIIDGFIVGLGAIPGVILMVVGGIGGGLAASSVDSDAAASGVVGIAFLLGYALLFIGCIGVWLYNCYLLGRDGATIGKRLMKVKVLDGQGQPLGFGKAFLREIVKQALGGACFILLLWPLWDEQKQGLQDKIFGTHVFEA